MADLSKIKLNGVIYNFKDAQARNSIPVVTSTYSASSTDAMNGVAVNSAITAALSSVSTTVVADYNTGRHIAKINNTDIYIPLYQEWINF